MEYRKMTRAELRGRALDGDCYMAETKSEIRGEDDKRVFCCGRVNGSTGEATKKCISCAAYMDNETPDVGKVKKDEAE